MRKFLQTENNGMHQILCIETFRYETGTVKLSNKHS